MPSGSTKDRIAAHILREAAEAGDLRRRLGGGRSVERVDVDRLRHGVRRDRRAVRRRDARRRERRARADDPPLRRRGRAHARRRRAAGAMAEAEAMAARRPARVPAATVRQPGTTPRRTACAPAPRCSPRSAARSTASWPRSAPRGRSWVSGAALRAAAGESVALARVRVAGGAADAEQGGPCADIPGVVDCMSAILDDGAVGLGPDIVVAHDDAMAATRDLIRRRFPGRPVAAVSTSAARTRGRHARPRPARRHRLLRPHGALLLDGAVRRPALRASRRNRARSS